MFKRYRVSKSRTDTEKESRHATKDTGKKRHNTSRQEIQQKDNTRQKQDKEVQKKDKEIQESKSLQDESILNRGGTYKYNSQQWLSDILSDEKKLRIFTAYDHEKFEYIYEKFEKHLKKTDMPLFIGDPKRGENRCNLKKRQALMLGLIIKRHGLIQEFLSVLFDIDQSILCRYIQLADPILYKILPV